MYSRALKYWYTKLEMLPTALIWKVANHVFAYLQVSHLTALCKQREKSIRTIHDNVLGYPFKESMDAILQNTF